MAERLLEQVILKDGHQLQIYDASRKLSKDRWVVSLLVKIDIPVVNSLFKQGKILTEELNTIKEVIGDKVVFEKKMQRLFVDQMLKEAVLSQLLADFRQNIMGYLNHPDFARKFVLRTYSEKKQKSRPSRQRF